MYISQSSQFDIKQSDYQKMDPSFQCELVLFPNSSSLLACAGWHTVTGPVQSHLQGFMPQEQLFGRPDPPPVVSEG